jgi:hypothetical protein
VGEIVGLTLGVRDVVGDVPDLSVAAKVISAVPPNTAVGGIGLADAVGWCVIAPICWWFEVASDGFEVVKGWTGVPPNTVGDGISEASSLGCIIHFQTLIILHDGVGITQS